MQGHKTIIATTKVASYNHSPTSQTLARDNIPEPHVLHLCAQAFAQELEVLPVPGGMFRFYASQASSTTIRHHVGKRLSAPVSGHPTF